MLQEHDSRGNLLASLNKTALIYGIKNYGIGSYLNTYAFWFLPRHIRNVPPMTTVCDCSLGAGPSLARRRCRTGTASRRSAGT